MVRDITFGQYYPGSSAVHKMDARMKFVLTFGMIVCIFVCRNFFSLGLMVLFTAATGLHFAYDLFCLRDAPALMKVKAFVFMTHGDNVTFIYYDMQKLEYCATSRNVMFSGRANIREGNYVNIIVRNRQNGYKVIRVLTF